MKINKFIIFTSAMFLALGGTIAFSKIGENNLMKETNAISISEDKLCYQLDEYITKSVNTFSAWIKLPTNLPDNQPGGIIMGNHMYSTMYSGEIEYTVAENGQFKLFWANNKYTHTFEKYDLRTGNWVHIALVRDVENSQLRYYVDGVLNDTIEDVNLPEATTHCYYRIGMDQASWYTDYFGQMDSPFKGEIRQISLFDDTLDETDINNVKNNTIITKDDYSSLMTNLNIANWGEEEKVLDTSGQVNAHLVSFNKKVPVKEVNDYDYSFIVVPDMQAMNRWKPANWLSQSDWIVKNKDDLNIKFAMYLGDMVEDQYAVSPTTCIEQWENASDYMSMLDGNVPYTFVPGNHDYDNWTRTSRATEMMNKYLPYSKYSQFDYFGGAYEKGKMENTYYLIKVTDDIEYLIFALEIGVRDRVLKWVDRVIEEHPRSRVIITTHDYLNAQGEKHRPGLEGGAPSKTITYDNCNDAIYQWSKCYSKHANIMSIFCGHECADDLTYIEDRGINNNHVYSILADLQGSMLTCAMNTVLLVKVNEKNKTWDMCYYWIDENACFNIQNQFQLSFADEFNPAIGKQSF